MDLKKKIVLVVEDEISLRQVLKEKLSLEGFEVFIAKNGKEAIKEVYKIHPDMILLDILMPEMTGLEFLHKLHENEQGKNMKVIILTNLNSNDTISKAMEEGGYSYLVKSDWDLDDIITKIKNELSI